MTKTLALAAVLCLWCAAAFGAQLTQAEYTAALARVEGELRKAAAQDKTAGVAVAHAALDQLPLNDQVVVESGRRLLPVDNTALVKSLRKQVKRGPRGIRAAAGLLHNLRDVSSLAPEAEIGHARAALEEVLSGREFRESWFEKLRQRMYAWLFRALEVILSWFPDLGLPKNLLAWIVWVLIGIAVIVVVTLVIRLVLRYEPRKGRRRTEEPAEELPVRTHQEWLAEAAARSEEGDYRRALRALHMAALLKLDEAGVVRFDQAATDGRFVRLLGNKGLHELAAALGALNSVFSVVWYGSAPAGPQEYAHARARWTELEALTAT